MKIIILGPPGAGKDTQAKRLSKFFKLKTISSGEILRKESRKKTAIGRKIKEYIDKGSLVPENILYKILRKYIGKSKNLILDGVPRSKEQLKFSFCRNPDYVILIDVPKNEVIKRIILRAKKENRADDKNISIIKKRYEKYDKSIKFILDFYKKKGKLITANGNQSRNKVFKEILNKIKR